MAAIVSTLAAGRASKRGKNRVPRVGDNKEQVRFAEGNGEKNVFWHNLGESC